MEKDRISSTPYDGCIDFLLENPQFLGKGASAFVTALILADPLSARYNLALYKQLKLGRISIDSRLFDRISKIDDHELMFFFLVNPATNYTTERVFKKLIKRVYYARRRDKKHIEAIAAKLHS